MKHMNITQFNSWTKTNIVYENKFDDNCFIIMENNKNYKSTGIIAKIFKDHWDEFFSNCKNTLNTDRPNADKEVHKMIDCSLHNLGTSIYVYPNDFSYNKIFICPNCNISMTPVSIEADF